MKTGPHTGYDVSLLDPGIALIQFNRPERMNGMSTAIKRSLIETLTQAQMDDRVRVVVFTGTGRAFCAGDDLKEFGARSGCRINRKNSDGWFRMDLRKGWIERAEVLFLKPKP